MILSKDQYKVIRNRIRNGHVTRDERKLYEKQVKYDRANYGFFNAFLTRKQAELVEFFKHYNELIIRGGVRSAKTFFDCFIICCRVGGFYPVAYEEHTTIWGEKIYKPLFKKFDLPNTRKRCRVWISCLNRPMQIAAGGMQDTLMEMLPKPWIKEVHTLCGKYIIKIILVNGSVIEFKSADVGRRGYQSATIDLFVADEAHTVDVIKEGMARSGLYPLKFVYSYYPEPEPSTVWAHDAYIVPEMDGRTPDYRKVTTVNYIENSMIPKPQRDDQVQRWKDSGEYEQRVYGEFGDIAGLVYKTFRRNRHVINLMDIPEFRANGGEPPEHWAKFMAVDTHNSAKGCAALMCAIDPSNGRRIYFNEYQDQNDPYSWIDYFNEQQEKYHFELAYIDPSAYATDAHGFSIGDKLEEETKIQWEKAIRSHSQGIHAVTMGLAPLRDPNGNIIDGLPGIMIGDHCHMTIRQLETYARKGNTTEVIKSNDEYCDCLRYIEVAEPQNWFGSKMNQRNFSDGRIDVGNPNLSII